MLYVLEEFELRSRRANKKVALLRVKKLPRRRNSWLDVDHQRPSQARLPPIHGRTHGGRLALPLHLGCGRAARLLRRTPRRTNAELSSSAADAIGAAAVARAAAAAPEEADVVHLRRVRADRPAAPAVPPGAAAVGCSSTNPVSAPASPLVAAAAVAASCRRGRAGGAVAAARGRGTRRRRRAAIGPLDELAVRAARGDGAREPRAQAADGGGGR